jgi:hypothetical protein
MDIPAIGHVEKDAFFFDLNEVLQEDLQDNSVLSPPTDDSSNKEAEIE